MVHIRVHMHVWYAMYVHTSIYYYLVGSGIAIGQKKRVANQKHCCAAAKPIRQTVHMCTVLLLQKETFWRIYWVTKLEKKEENKSFVKNNQYRMYHGYYWMQRLGYVLTVPQMQWVPNLKRGYMPQILQWIPRFTERVYTPDTVGIPI